MTKEEMQTFLGRAIDGLADFANGYKQCAENVLKEYERREKEANGTGLPANDGNTPVAS